MQRVFNALKITLKLQNAMSISKSSAQCTSLPVDAIEASASPQRVATKRPVSPGDQPGTASVQQRKDEASLANGHRYCTKGLLAQLESRPGLTKPKMTKVVC
jgi:hypothetical protein